MALGSLVRFGWRWKGIATAKSAVPAYEARMTKWKTIALIAAGALAVLALFTATVLPVLVRNKAVEVLREATGRNVRIEKVSLNPLTLTASVQGFAV